MTPTLVSRWRAIPRARRRLIREAAAELVRARLSLRLQSFRTIIAGGIRPLGQMADAAASGDIVEAVLSAARHLPWTPVCFDLGLAVQRMLRRRGHDAALHYGIAMAEPALKAHVWISLGGTVLIGGEEAGAMREVARYPAAR
ncbi:lasso peptide biosynthesis B2 protein [Sphingomonas sp. ASV193]|uniref:lasso peptide biosynthesis B2 protein n=1 Tax=Sphingomonas sp. ASV193 TaxID=3144405 RepID=UPI0032E8CE4E